MNPIYDWLNEFYSFYMAAIVGFVISRCGPTIEPHHGNQPNMSMVFNY